MTKYTFRSSARALLVASLVGCGGSDGPSGQHPPDGGAAGTFGAAGAVGGAMMPSQMGNGPPGGQGGLASPGAAGKGGAGGMGSAGHGSAGTSGGTAGGSGSRGTGGSAGSDAGAGAGGAQVGRAGSSGGAGMAGTGGMAGANPETGRLAGITAAHNAVRAAVETTPPLAPLVWSDTLAAYAQQWADNEASTACANPQHRSARDLDAVGYGENLAVFISSFGSSTAEQAVSGWAAEKMCYTFGTFMTADKCDTACYTKLNSDGCGHYTQIVWRTTTEVGCGVGTCQNGSAKEDIWICNYKPPGNYIGRNPY